MPSFDIIPTASISDPAKVYRTWRTNCLGSLYFFIKIGLRRKRLTDHLHWQVCNDLESERLKDVYEMPRDHFKSTICTEGLPMWKALPFNYEDEVEFRNLGYGDEYIRWMYHAHNPQTRILLISENITNAAKLGARIRGHFESGAVFRTLFPEILPTSSCKWTDFSLCINRGKTASPHGEGTFDFIGVGGALQSRHYTGGIIEDDLVGKKAIESPSVMDATIDYHKLLLGAFEDEDPNHEGDELVVGNRWGFNDLNSHIREFEPWFRFTTHGAMGGCCPAHPAGVPIFPEEFSYAKLMRIKARQGAYKFSCQYLNDPISPEDADFKIEWLRYFTIEKDFNQNKLYIKHKVRNGVVIPDVYIEDMAICITADPNHAGEHGRARHAITVVGKAPNEYTYLLDCWAEACGYDKFYNQLFKMAEKWKLHRVGFETIAAQRYAAHHIEFLNGLKPWYIRIMPLKGEVEAQDGTITRNKEFRIRNVIGPIAECEQLCIKENMEDFKDEYCRFPRGRYVDLLDAFAYHVQLIKRSQSNMPVDKKLLASNLTQARRVNAPYSMRIQ